ncbi:MAG: bacillithiol biosynthesis cysteine-adding enzyme BshC [Acidobacteriota bacterium]|nr:bacillithiol biosynthesis cysteine-adding enzyme BshC [Acidobacteriota bacterium]
MSATCFPITVLPHVSRLYREYLAMSESAAEAPLRQWYSAEPTGDAWMHAPVTAVDRTRLAEALHAQSLALGAGPAALANIEQLRHGARAVVTGQQVGLLGGPLLTLLKAATAVARAREATASTGMAHVPVFWLATEDHDLAEVNQISLPGRSELQTLRAQLQAATAVPVGGVALGPEIEGVLAEAEELLGYAPVCELLRACYAPQPGYTPTLGSAFGRLMATLFAAHGLIVLDASAREFHALGASTLAFAIEHADQLETALLERSQQLQREGYHAQVLVAPGHSLLFLIDPQTGERHALRRTQGGGWKAAGKPYTSAELLAILAAEPERISPNALLRPVFQDTILPVAAYIGGPAEIAYFAQSAVVYQAVLGRCTPVLPRLSATLVEPAIAAVMARHEVSLPDVMATTSDLAQRLGARAMPIAGKRKLAAAGNALDAELTALTEYLAAMDESLGRSAVIAGNKMRYQMNRLRRMAATFELQKEASLGKHAAALTLHLYPEGHPQERATAGVWFVARYGEGLVDRLVEAAENKCPGHLAITL